MKEESQLVLQRIRKTEDLRGEGIDPFTNKFKAVHVVQEVLDAFQKKSSEDLDKTEKVFSLAGRLMSIRNFGKSVFVHIQDRTGKIQAYIRKDIVGNDNFRIFKKFDIGDFIGIIGTLFRTNSGELTIMVKK
ncbi:MAG: OB-fold nucleic acid binding domain-containing protein, partial [Thermodesulfobacteriota bacterium]|nr:OB-fold nucleic acid binding domain-containing protein [Thermodesulfobacteriota bacterium]